MSKRSEEAAQKAYPELLSGSIFGPLPVDLNKASREKYQEGYEQAEKDFLERAITWLKENGDCYTWYNEFEGESGITEGLIEEFKKAMEE